MRMSRRICTSAGHTYVWQKWNAVQMYVAVWTREHQNTFSAMSGDYPLISSGYQINGTSFAPSGDQITYVRSASFPTPPIDFGSVDQFVDWQIEHADEYPYFFTNFDLDDMIRNIERVQQPGYTEYYFDRATATLDYGKGETLLEVVRDKNGTAYPDNGYQDGYWYIKQEA